MFERPKLPENESARLAALHRYGILDASPEPAFDGLTELASTICGTGIALISLVDADRQWFLSRVGLDAEETSRDVSFCGHAINEPDQLMQVPDAQVDLRFAGNPLVTGSPEIRFYAGMPLVSPDGHAIGTLCVIDKRPKRLTRQQERMLGLIARQVMDQLERRRELLAHEEQSRVLAAIMDSVSAEIVYYDAEERTRLWNSHYEHNFRTTVGRSPAVGEPMEALIRERASKTELPEEAVNEFMSKRLAYHQCPEGDLPVDLPNGRSVLIREAPVAGGGFVATLVDVTPMRNVERELEELARTDPLTGLANRRRFFEVANHETGRAARYSRPMSMLAMDIDHFKNVNDQHGHDVGDAVIQHIAEIARASTRSADLVARVGGEEFAVLLPETGPEDAARLAERIRSSVETSAAQSRAGEVSVTVSIGVDGYRPGDTDADDALVRADALLYEAKRAGRNRVATPAAGAKTASPPVEQAAQAD